MAFLLPLAFSSFTAAATPGSSSATTVATTSDVVSNMTIIPTSTSSNCTDESEDDLLPSDMPVVAVSAVSILFNIFIFLTNVNRRRRTRKPLDPVLVQFTVLAVTDLLASLALLIHYSTRMSYKTKGKLEAMLNDRFQSNDTMDILVEDGKYVTYVSSDFILIKKSNATCGNLYIRYFTMRWFTEASNRLLLVYMNISRTVALYKGRTVLRTELKSIFILSVFALVVPGIFMLVLITMILLKVRANFVMYSLYSITYVLPFFVLLITSILLIKKIKSVGQAVEKLRTTARRNTTAAPQKTGKNEKNKQQLITVVIVVTVVYLITHLPGLVHLCGKANIWKPSPLMNSILSRASSVMIAVNSLVNFPLFLCLSDQFLLEFRHLFGCLPPDQRKTETTELSEDPGNKAETKKNKRTYAASAAPQN